MNREKLNGVLLDIRNRIGTDNPKDLLLLMDKIFEIKPVTLLYFNVRAAILCEIGEYLNAIELLNGNLNLCYPEDEHIESCKIYQKAFKAMNLQRYQEQFLFLEKHIKFQLGMEEDVPGTNDIERRIVELEQAMLDGDCGEASLLELAEQYFKSFNTTEAIVLFSCYIKKTCIDYSEHWFFKDWVSWEPNGSFLIEQLLKGNETFILFAEQMEYYRCQLLAKVIKIMGHEVIIMTEPLSVEVENEIDLKDTVAITIENIEYKDDIQIVRPILIIQKGEIKGNNTSLVLERFSDISKNNIVFVIGNGIVLDTIYQTDFDHIYQRLSCFKSDLYEQFSHFGYFGSYISYIDKLFDFNVKEAIEAPAECKFSIVIPVRNSASTLKYTLDTCLEQYGIASEDYEIVISDNSSAGNFEVYNLVHELQNPRIRYYKTNREFPLNRSFEYAFLRARGEFIFSIGADDAVLPWGLRMINDALKELPDDDLLAWDRGFFIWPGMENPAQSGQFNIPRNYRKDNIEIKKFNCLQFLLQLLVDPDILYSAPMLYINSGFKRGYIKQLLSKTGCLWDGFSQDIYMGIVNLSINDTIPCLNAPITIAGMANDSCGASYNKGEESVKQLALKVNHTRQWIGFGAAVISGKDRSMLATDLDTVNLYSSFIRVKNRVGSQKLDLVESKLAWKEIFKTLARKHSISDIKFDYKIKFLLYSAYYLNDELGKWFEEEMLPELYETRHVSAVTDKIYKEGFNESGGLCLDSRKFGIEDVYQCSKLFEKICNL
ncbi:MAG: glycosyltransferase family 2 protein [Clostridiales bacterium]|nr:glycosyltransferase family 2 protein [Clostridiales bacterium]